MGPSQSIVIICLTIALSLILSPTNAQKPKEKTTKVIAASNKAIPYETVNKFCLYKRLDVDKPFCPRLLKSPHAENAKPNDLIPLLEVAINSTSIFICKTLSLLQNLSDNKTTKPALLPAVKDCLSAYEDIAGYITNVVSDASQESTIAGLDGEVIEYYIKRCVKALGNNKAPEISDRNKEAKKHAKLVIDIADNLSSKKPELKI